MKRIKVGIEGVSPLLMNPVTEELLDEIHSGVRKPKTDKSAEDEAKEKVYEEDGRIGIPVINLCSSLVEAGRLLKADKKRNISTATSTLLYSFLAVEEIFLPFNNGAEWKVDKRRGRNSQGGGLVRIVRPRFDKWGFELTIQVDEGVVNLDTTKQLFEKAGSAVGLCDFRPACRGPFGRFKVVKWEEISQEEQAA